MLALCALRLSFCRARLRAWGELAKIHLHKEDEKRGANSPRTLGPVSMARLILVKVPVSLAPPRYMGSWGGTIAITRAGL